MRQCPKLAQLYSHEAAVNHAEFSPDGKSVLSASDDHTARIWDVASGQLRIPPLRHTGAVSHAAFSADGRWVVTASADQTARVWDAATGKPRTPSLRHAASVSYAAFSSDGSHVLTLSNDKKAQLWDATTGEAVAPPLQHNSRVHHGCFSPDGRLVATGCEDGTARIWDASPGQQRTLTLDSGATNDPTYIVQFSLDGARLLTAGWRAIIWDATTGKQMVSLAHRERLRYAAFSPDGSRVVTASYDQTARVWNAATGTPITPPLRHDRQVWRASFSPDGTMLVTASLDCNIRLWNAGTGEFHTGIIRQSGQIRNVSFSPDGRQILVASQSRSVSIWDLSGAEPLVSHLPTSSVAHDVVFSPDGRLAIILTVSAGAFGWDLAAAKPLTALWGNLNLIRSAHFSRDGRWLALGNSDGSAIVCDVTTGRPAKSAFLQHRGPVNHLEFSPDMKWLLSASGDASACVWDMATGNRISQMAHQGPVAYASFTPDGKQVVTATINRPQRVLDDHEWSGALADPRTGMYAASNVLQLWHAETGKPAERPLHIPPAASLASFSLDRGRVVNSCSAVNDSQDKVYLEKGRAEVCIWDIRSGRKLSPPLYPASPDCLYASFSPDGAKLVTTSLERTAQVWDGHTGKPAGPVLQHGHEVHHASFSHDGCLIATACRDRTVRIWETDTGDPVGPPLKHGFRGANPPFEAPVRVFFSPDGQRLVSCTSDRNAHLWDLSNEEHSLKDDLLMTELLANASIDETGTLTLLGSNFRAGLETEWRRLLITYPTILGVSPEQRLTWKLAWKNERRAEDAKEYFERAHVSERSGRFIDAIRELSQAIALDPYYVWAYKKRGQVFLLLKEYEKAAADFQKAIEMCPESPHGYNELAWLYVNGPSAFRNPAKALPLSLKAVELSTTCCDELNTLGSIYYRLGQWEKAAETLEKSANAGRIGVTAYDFFFLAMTYSCLGQTARAEESYAKGIDSWNNHPAWFSPLCDQEIQELRAETEAVLQKQRSNQQRDGRP